MDPHRRRFLQGTAIALGATVASNTGVATEANSDSAAGINPENVSTARSADGMAASTHIEATRAGVEVLKDGGNAIDAAAAVQLALNVVEPEGSGVGGGSHMMIYSAEDDNVFTIDGYAHLPAAAHPELYLQADGDHIPYEEVAESGLASGVPCTLRALDVALKRYGSKYFDEIIQPAINLAEDGIEVEEALASAIDSSWDKFTEEAREVFGDGNDPLEEGDLLVQEDLANTFELIGEKGPQVFYQGEIGEALAEAVHEHGGVMTHGDLKRATVNINQPVWLNYKDTSIAVQPPSSWGGQTVASCLKFLEPYNLGQFDQRSADNFHHIIEALRFISTDLDAHLADPEFVDVPYQGLLSDDYLEERRESFDPNQVNPGIETEDVWAYQPGGPYRTSAHANLTEQSSGDNQNSPSSNADRDGVASTTHFTTADREGNVVAMGSTISSWFGTGIMVPDYGIMVNNSNHKMGFYPGGVNEIQPHKRRPSAIAPTMAFQDGELYITVGGAGGDQIPGAVLQVLLNVLEHDMGPAEAFAAPRMHGDHWVHMADENPEADLPEIAWEDGVPENVRNDLLDRGHQLSDEPDDIAYLQAIMVQDGEYVGVGTPRRDGHAEGI